MHIHDGEHTFTLPDGAMFHLRGNVLEGVAVCGVSVGVMTSAVSIVDCAACLNSRREAQNKRESEVWH